MFSLTQIACVTIITMTNRKGFTLVELVIAIAVIGILITLASLGLNQYTKYGRDASRSTEVTTLSEALEKYYDVNGEYPSCAAMTAPAATVVSTTLKGLDASALVTPNAAAGTTNSIQCTDLTDVNGTDYIAYLGDGSPTCNTTSCLLYTLKYIDEAENEIVVLGSRRQQDIDTSGPMTLTNGAISYTTATVNWTAVSNALGYTLERDTSNAFNTPNLRSYALAPTATTHTSNDLAPGTTYYYRANVDSSSGTSSWSNTSTRLTTSLPIPTLSRVQNTPVQITASWTAGSGITSYTLQRSSTAGFTAGTFDQVVGNVTSNAYTDTPIGAARYYRVRTNTTNAVGTVYNGTWSSVITYTSFVPAPTTPSIAASLSLPNAIGTSGAVTCTQGGTPQYSLREAHKTNSASADSWTAFTGWSPSVMTYSVAALEGHEHKFQSRAACLFSGSYSAAISSATTPSVVRTINTPAAPTWPSGLSKTWYNGVGGNYMNYGTYCPAGTWVSDTWFHSQAWPAATPVDYYHTFGFDDYWYLGPGGGANVFYEADYTCGSSYTNSARSPRSADTIWVAP